MNEIENEIEKTVDNYLKTFVGSCDRVFRLTCAFTNRTRIPADEFVAKVKDYGAVRSDVDFYDCYFKTKQCFETVRLVDGCGMTFTAVHPERYKFDPEPANSFAGDHYTGN